VVDCLIALTTDRPYRPAVSFDRALAFIVSRAGVSFDPEVVATLVRCADDFRRLEGAQEQGAAKALDAFLAPITQAQQELQRILELSRRLGKSLSLSETLETLAEALREMVPFDCLAVYIQGDETLVPEYVTGLEYSAFFSLELPAGAGVSGRAAETGKPILNGDPADEFRHLSGDSCTSMRSALALPLEGSADLAGVLTLYRKDAHGFGVDDLRILQNVQGQLAAAIENAVRFKRAEDSATTDHLTRLPNARSLFLHLENELSRCRRNGEPLTVLLCDLDGFKNVNDEFGHLNGNKVLRAVSRVLEKSCREYDFVARLGGDEFVMVLPGLPAGVVASRIQHLAQAAAEAAEEACHGCEVTLSIGQARYPMDGHKSESLLETADRRMYAEKQRRKPHAPVRGYDFDWMGREIPAPAVPAQDSLCGSVASTRSSTSIE